MFKMFLKDFYICAVHSILKQIALYKYQENNCLFELATKTKLEALMFKSKLILIFDRALNLNKKRLKLATLRREFLIKLFFTNYYYDYYIKLAKNIQKQKRIIKKAKAQIKMIKIYKHVSDKFVNLHNVTNFTLPYLINLT
jgi:CRISPR/Cas system-associated protein endoribonuclease Cas2